MIKERPIVLFLFISFVLLLVVSCQESPTEEVTERPTTSLADNNSLETVTATSSATETAVSINTSTPKPEPTENAVSEDVEENTAVPTATPKPENTATPVPPTLTPTRPGPGALVGLTMNSQVGVLLDEIPEDERDRLVEELLERPDEYWESLAKQQVLLTYNRLHFRPFFYERLKWQLPLPPKPLWEIELSTDGPRRDTIQNHDYVLIDYTFNSTLLTDQESPAVAEPNLRTIGGTWTEPFVLPVDPNATIATNR